MRSSIAVSLVLACTLAGCKKDAAPAASEAPPPAPQSVASPVEQPPAATPTPEPEAKPTPGPGVAPKAAKDEDDSRRNLLRDPSTLAEAETQLTQARADLDKLLGKAGDKAGKGAERLTQSDARCPDACKAMTSLRRAAAAVCRLAGDSADRCTRAKNIVKDSEAKLAVCKCDPDKE